MWRTPQEGKNHCCWGGKQFLIIRIQRTHNQFLPQARPFSESLQNKSHTQFPFTEWLFWSISVWSWLTRLSSANSMTWLILSLLPSSKFSIVSAGIPSWVYQLKSCRYCHTCSRSLLPWSALLKPLITAKPCDMNFEQLSQDKKAL